MVYYLRLPIPKYSSIWDADILLRFWKQIKDNSHWNLLKLSKKVTTFYVLLHGFSISTTVTFDINLIKRLNYLQNLSTREYLKRRAEYNDVHTKFLFTTVSPYGPTHKDAIATWVKIHWHKQNWIQKIFHFIVVEHMPTVRLMIWCWYWYHTKTRCWSRQSTFRKFYSKEWEDMKKVNRVAEIIMNSFDN